MKTSYVITKMRSFVLIAVVALSVLVPLFSQTNTAQAATCSFSLDEEKDTITERCGSGDISLKREGEARKYSRSYNGAGDIIANCKEQVTMASDTKGTHKVFYGSAEQTGASLKCGAVSLGSVSVSTTGGTGATSIRNALNDIINKDCASQANNSLKNECVSTWENVINQCVAAERNPKGGESYKASLAKCIADKKSYSESQIKNALKNIDEDIANLDKIEKCRKDGKVYSEGLDKCVEECEDGQTLNDDGKCVNSSACSIDGIGWIICPIFYFMGNLNDKAFEAIDGILTVEPELLTDKTTEDVWKSFRNIANVLFVIAFLVIIYSQMTGFGVSNYGLKRLLPKIIIAAILVNVSFYICQVAVDVSNILGSSLRSLFETIPTDVKSGGSGPTTWDGVMGAVLTVGVGVGLLAVVFLAPSVLLAFGLVLLILVARKALIILLIIVSPLALVAYLLPNTEQWAKKWWKIFSSLLLLFPIIAVVFGASELASNILMGVAQKGGEGGDQQTLLAVVALAVAAVPLFAIPALLKGSLAGAGSIGQKVAGIQDKANKRTSARLGSRRERYGNKLRAGNIKRADDIRGSQKFGSALGDANSRRRRSLAVLGGAGATRAVDNEEKDKYAKISSDAAKRNYVADRAAGDETYAKKLGGGEDLKGLVQSYAVQAQEEEFEKDAKASQVLLRNKAKGMTADGYRSHLESAITSGDLHDRVAAMNEYGSVASDEKVEGLANQMAQLGATSTDSNEKVRMQRAFASSFNDRMPINLGATDKANMQSGNFTADEATRMANTVAGGKVSSGHIGRMKFDEMTAWNKNLTSNNALLESAGSEKVASLIASIESAEKDPRLNVNFGERETTQLAIMKNELQKQFQVAAKHDQDSAASTYGPNI